MPRDYKNAGAGSRPGVGGSGFLSFLSGLSIGLVVAFAVLVYQFKWHLPREEIAVSPATPATKEEAKSVKSGTDAEPAIPLPTFDFYHILPKREVNISEWVAEESGSAKRRDANGGLYILQVGSFKTLDAADQIKARLALIGIQADIQRVVINGQDIRHRVRIGPYTDAQVFDQTRRRLLENDIDFMVLKLKIEESQAKDG